jgi:hypothetical protein
MTDYKKSDHILAFINSVKSQFNPNQIDLIILYKNISEEIINDTKKTYPEVFLEDFSSYDQKFGIDFSQSIYHTKYLIIYYYLREVLKKKYNYILLSDINDVFIQNDIFNQNILNQINFFAEPLNLGQSPINLKKYKACYPNEKKTNLHQQQKVINNGIILSKHDSILSYLDVYLEELLKIIKTCKIINADQVILTYCVHNYFNTWESVTVHNSPNKLCAHLSQIYRLGILDECISLKEKKISYLGLEPCIIHQYNRCDKLTNFIFSQFGLVYKKPKFTDLISHNIKRMKNRLKRELNQLFKSFF